MSIWQYVDESDYSSHAAESGGRRHDLITKRFLEQFMNSSMPPSPPTTTAH
jgi:hypothetical protein